MSDNRPPYSGHVAFRGGATRFNFGPSVSPWRAFTRGRGWVWVHDLRVGDEVSLSILDDRSGCMAVESVVIDGVTEVLES